MGTKVFKNIANTYRSVIIQNFGFEEVLESV